MKTLILSIPKCIDINEAMNVAKNAEESRDFSPTLNGITIGFSTGTSGNKGLFMVSNKEEPCG